MVKMLPNAITINAWFGPNVSSECPLDDNAKKWLRQINLAPARIPLLAGASPIWTQWKHPSVGWSLLLSHRNDLTTSQLAEPDPENEFEPIRCLWEARSRPPIYRYNPANPSYLRRHARQGEVGQQDLDIAQTGYGIGVDQVPFYLLISGGPKLVSWQIQFKLNLSRAVGRLDLPKEGLDHYVSALLNGWTGSASNPLNTVVWATDGDWVTKVMKAAVAQPLYDCFKADDDLRQGARYLEGDHATVEALRTALREQHPGLIVTTSHGCMDQSQQGLAGRLGVPVDALHELLLPSPLTDGWQPDGAVWLGLACCSAGVHSPNSFHGLLNLTSLEHQAIEHIASQFGPVVAPLPRALLGATKPLRAFVGHVEPTFDRTWYDEDNKQRLATFLVEAFYQHLYQRQPEPIGWALRNHFLQYGALRDEIDVNRKAWNNFEVDAPRRVMDAALRALDVRNLVILGDPTVALDLGSCSSLGLSSVNSLPTTN
jgi:hypothetical protein